MFDADGLVTYTLTQDIALPTGLTTAQLSWQDAVIWNVVGGTAAPRVFSVQFLDISNALLGTVYTQAYTGTGADPWTARSFDVLAMLAAYGGQTVRLRFSVDVPETWTGPAGLGLDAVSLDVDSVPEPGSLLLLGSGLIGLAFWKRRARKA